MGKHLEILTAKFHHIDETITSSSEIRLMDVCDTEDMSLWIETTVEGGRIRLQEGDLILKVIRFGAVTSPTSPWSEGTTALSSASYP